jgi:hypothetical protein
LGLAETGEVAGVERADLRGEGGCEKEDLEHGLIIFC